MSVIGKIIGGAVGLALGGPLGAVAGAIVGHHAYDADEENASENREYVRLSDDEEKEAVFFMAVFSMLAKMAKADGQVSKPEIDSIQQFMITDLHLPPQARQSAMNVFLTALDSPRSFGEFARQFYTHFQKEPRFLDMMMDILLRVSVADGFLKPAEETLLQEAADVFGLSEADYQKIKSRYVRSADSAPSGKKNYATLGCSPEDSDEIIKTRYRKKVAEFHPDKIASKGLPDEFLKFANNKFREIQEAYETIKKERGMS